MSQVTQELSAIDMLQLRRMTYNFRFPLVFLFRPSAFFMTNR